MHDYRFDRRTLLKTAGAGALLGVGGSLLGRYAAAQQALNIWTIGVAKVGAQPGTGGKDWSAMAEQAGVALNYNAKSGSADQAIQKMIVGDGNKLYDALTDNGGGMEDALASQGAIVPIDPAKITNWDKLLALYAEGQPGADTIRAGGELYAVPYISNADSLAFNHDKIGAELDTWEALFDEQFRGRAAMQNDFGPTLTNTAIYLKQSGKQDIDNPSDMSEAEVKGVAEFLIDLKKKGHFRTFWGRFPERRRPARQRRSAGQLLLGTGTDRGRQQGPAGHPLRHHARRPPDLEQRLDVDQGRPRARPGRGVLQAHERISFALVRRPHAAHFRFCAADDRYRRLRQGVGRFRRHYARNHSNSVGAQTGAL